MEENNIFENAIWRFDEFKLNIRFIKTLFSHQMQ